MSIEPLFFAAILAAWGLAGGAFILWRRGDPALATVTLLAAIGLFSWAEVQTGRGDQLWSLGALVGTGLILRGVVYRDRTGNPDHWRVTAGLFFVALCMILGKLAFFASGVLLLAAILAIVTLRIRRKTSQLTSSPIAP